MSQDQTATRPSDCLVKVREWVEGGEQDEYEWPAPPEFIEYVMVGQMRADVLARVGRSADDPCVVRVIQGVIEGGYSEFTVEHDYTIEVWVDDKGQSQRAFADDLSWSHESSLSRFLEWVAPTS